MIFFKKLFKPLLAFLITLSFRTKSAAFEPSLQKTKTNDEIHKIIDRKIEKRNFINNLHQMSRKSLMANNAKYFSTIMKIDNPSWISGFVDGEGCFSISFNKREKLTTGVEVRPSFSIAQKADSVKALENIKNFFDCGSIRYSARDGCYKYEVRSINEIVGKIIPHFEKYTLKTQKKNDFETFSRICKDINQNKHLNANELKTIIKDAYTMNKAGKRKYSYEEIIKHIEEKN
jgi:hypothetical protein